MTTYPSYSNAKLQLGWREWVSLPSIDLPVLKAKVDTGAKTSALDALYIESFQVGRQEWVRFGVKPLAKYPAVVTCHAPLIDWRWVRDSGGHRDYRPVILSTLSFIKPCADSLLPQWASWTIEITLAKRDSMRFRMLLGRQALNQNCMIDPSQSYLQGAISRVEACHYYSHTTSP